MFWILARQDARRNWLLTGWRTDGPDKPDVMLTPYIEFDKEDQLIDFLKSNNRPVFAQQVTTHQWLVANQLFCIGQEESTP